MAGLNLLDLLNHDDFVEFLWRNQAKIRHIFSNIVRELTGFSHHNDGNKCHVERISHRSVAKSKSKNNNRLSYVNFKLENINWLSEQNIHAEFPENEEVQVMLSWVTVWWLYE